jgi:hypothetical protein
MHESCENRGMIIVYGISNCDTVKKARAWLTAQGLAHDFHDFKKLGVPADRLPAWESAVSWQKLLNRQGTTWRKLDPAVQAGADAGPCQRDQAPGGRMAGRADHCGFRCRRLGCAHLTMPRFVKPATASFTVIYLNLCPPKAL